MILIAGEFNIFAELNGVIACRKTAEFGYIVAFAFGVDNRDEFRVDLSS